MLFKRPALTATKDLLLLGPVAKALGLGLGKIPICGMGRPVCRVSPLIVEWSHCSVSVLGVVIILHFVIRRAPHLEI